MPLERVHGVILTRLLQVIGRTSPETVVEALPLQFRLELVLFRIKFLVMAAHPLSLILDTMQQCILLNLCGGELLI
jgi:hypothetical protein